MRFLLLLVLAILAAGSCTTGSRVALRQASEGSCQRACADEHPDSLYDRNRCLEDCEPP